MEIKQKLITDKVVNNDAYNDEIPTPQVALD
jgi:hypothetical protein